MENSIGARPGDLVEIALPGHTELGISLLVWVVPLIGLVGGAVLGALTLQSFGLDQDLAALAGAVAGFFAAFFLLRRIDARMARKRNLIPYVRRVLEACSSATVQGHRETS